MSYLVIIGAVVYLLSLIMIIKNSLNKHEKIKMTNLGITGFCIDLSTFDDPNDGSSSDSSFDGGGSDGI